MRLVILESGTEEDEIRCKIIHTDIYHAGRYEALSYAWGDTTNKMHIVLDNELFEVTQNLESALRNLRHPSPHARTLWIDAICIDQQNHDERNAQVQRMKSIYEVAVRVVIWLGRYHEAEDDSLTFKEDIWGFGHLDPGTLELTQSAFQLVEILSTSTPIMSYIRRGPAWAHLTRIVQRSWFRRLWVVQEVKVAKYTTLMCGRCITTWRKLKHATMVIGNTLKHAFRDRVESLLFLSEVTMTHVLHISLVNADPTNLLSVLQQTASAETTDPRDRLFGIIGITWESGSRDIDVDYSKPPNIVYRDWAISRIQRKKNLDVFSACEDSGKFGSMKDATFPSWVPDLRQAWGSDLPLFELAHGFPGAGGNILYAAGDQSSTDAKFSADKLEITLSGVSIDSIALLSTPAAYSGSFGDLGSIMAAIVDSWEEMLINHFGASFSRETPLYAAFLDVLFRGYVTYVEKTHTSLQARYSAWRGSNPRPPNPEPQSLGEVLESPYNSMELILFMVMQDNQFFITVNGHLGIIAGNCHAKIGDVAYVLLGGITPFVLRRHNGLSQEHQYRLMGPCYLGGYMHGEAIAALKEDKLQLEEITMI
jgi:hypothetical protein